MVDGQLGLHGQFVDRIVSTTNGERVQILLQLTEDLTVWAETLKQQIAREDFAEVNFYCSEIYFHSWTFHTL